MDSKKIIDAEFVDTGELVPSKGQAIPGFSVPLTFNPATELQIANAKLPIHFRMKAVPMATVEQVVKNEPMPDVPRVYPRVEEGQQDNLLNSFLSHLFPAMTQFTSDFRVLDADDAMLDNQVRQAAENLNELGMTNQIQRMESEVQRFKLTRSALKFTREEGLVRPDTIIPMRYLPDLFMAVPVWFYYAGRDQLLKIQETNRQDDPLAHPFTMYFCNQFQSQRWRDTFQLYNRRLRSLQDYGGEGFDLIPPFVARRLKWATQAFDVVVIATPYHDIAAKDWQDANWLRSIDPYVLGFKKGIPYFFILARFSDSGTFPLYHQLVGDTIEYLRRNIDRLRGFNQVVRPYWYKGVSPQDTISDPGEYLQRHVRGLLRAFDQGKLFDWLRMEDSTVSTTR